MLRQHSHRAITTTAAIVLSAVLAPGILRAVETTAPAESAPAGTTCGNALLEPGETCESCAADCTPQECTPDTAKPTPVNIVFTAPKESLDGDVRSFTPVAATITVGYRTNRLHMPATGTDRQVRARIGDLESASETVIANDLDHSLRLVVTDTKRLMPALMTIGFDTCKDAPAPVDTDLTCIVEACAGHGGPLADCYCKAIVATPK